jgi:uncharacterized protein with LGFP repeats
MRKLMLPLTAMLVLAASARADTVTLKDGKIVEGTFLGASADHVTFQIEGHTKCRFAVDEIQSIRFARSKTTSPIDQKYSGLKGSEAALGQPAGEEEAAPDGRGRYRLYQNGAIYYTPQTGAHAVRGPIGNRWLSLGAERSELGYPGGDETIWPDGRRSMTFEHGTIIWDQQDVPLVEISAH